MLETDYFNKRNATISQLGKSSILDNDLALVRRETEEQEDPNYDYESLKQEYEAAVIESKLSNKTLNFTDVKEDESVKEALEIIVKSKIPGNCTEEEMSGIGD